MKKVCIGLPIYNGERFLRSKLDSILNQTYKDFDLIISNNGSTDKTHEICIEYAIKDERIRYFSHKKNNEALWNFKFVLDQANCDYFMWTAVDDIFLPTFIEKTIILFEKNDNCVAAISKIDTYNPKDERNYFKSNELKYFSTLKNLRNKLRSRNIFTLSGNFKNKSRKYLKNSSCQVFYSIFKTDVIKSSFVNESFLGNDWVIFLNVLKHGDLVVTDEVLMSQYERGSSGKGIILATKQFNSGLNIYFPWYSLTNNCIRYFGWKFFLKNLDYFLLLSIEAFVSIVFDILYILKYNQK